MELPRLLVNITKQALSSFRALVDVLFSRLYTKEGAYAEVDLHGKRAFVTGSNIGIGKEIALSLAKRGAEVFLLCRNDTKAKLTQEEIIRISGNPNVHVELVDFLSLSSVRSLVERWGRRQSSANRQVDILINNAGLVLTNKQTTLDGFETCYQVNMLGPFLLTILFLHHGFFSQGARVIQVSSNVLYVALPPNPKDLGFKSLGEGASNLYASGLFGFYSSSKAQQVIFTKELQRRLSCSSKWGNITVQSCHPGLVTTSILKRPRLISSEAIAARLLSVLTSMVGIGSKEGAETVIFLATAVEAGEKSSRGGYWEHRRQKWVPFWMNDDRLSGDLWRSWIAHAGLEDLAFEL